jgi:N-methylhydantoinase B
VADARVIDALTVTVVWKRLLDIAEEMGTALRRTAYSAGIREAEDLSVALFDRDINLISTAVYTPGQVGSMPQAVRNALLHIPVDELRPGDGILLNDSYLGNGHLPDVYCISPIYRRGELVGYAASCGHHMDIGGSVPGSQRTEGVFDMFAEGMRILPVKAFVAGKPVKDVMRLITGNVRRPRDTAGDLSAQMNACVIGAERFVTLLDEYEDETVKTCIREIHDRGENAVRRALRAIPPGRYEFEDFMDDYGPGTDPLRIAVAAEIGDGAIHIDFAGTSEQVRAAINCPFNFTYAWTLYAVRAMTTPAVPESEGTRRPISVSAPERTFVNPVPPAPSGARATAAMRIVDAVMGALGKAAPERGVAAPSHFCNATYGGMNKATGEAYIGYEMLLGGFGARPDKDGEDGLVASINCTNIPVEVQEATNPVLIERLEYITDSAGPGTYRGGTGIRRDVRLLDDLSFTTIGDRFKFPPWGLRGGGSGTPGSAMLVRDGSTTALSSKITFEARRGDLFINSVSGAGGSGDPFEREPSAILQDVLDGFVSVESARRDYGVAVVDDAIDKEATARLRATRRGAAELSLGTS